MAFIRDYEARKSVWNVKSDDPQYYDVEDDSRRDGRMQNGQDLPIPDTTEDFIIQNLGPDDVWVSETKNAQWDRANARVVRAGTSERIKGTSAQLWLYPDTHRISDGTVTMAYGLKFPAE
ncbi:MAG: hypothetical protein ABJN26_00150 [Stappiaceae bacterium]